MVKYIRPQMDVKEFVKENILTASTGGSTDPVQDCTGGTLGYGGAMPTTAPSGGGGARSVGDDFIIG